MNKRTILVCLILAAIPSNFYALTDRESAIIPHASYMIYENCNCGRIYDGNRPEQSKTVTFYTYNGNPLQTIEHNQCFEDMSRKLDPHAPKPQPIFCQCIPWAPCFEYPIRDYIKFIDKNHHTIRVYHYDKQAGSFTAFSENGLLTTYHFKTIEELRNITTLPLDLSAIQEIKELRVKGL